MIKKYKVEFLLKSHRSVIAFMSGADIVEQLTKGLTGTTLIIHGEPKTQIIITSEIEAIDIQEME